MPNIPQINIEGTVYKLKDAELRDNIILAQNAQPANENNRIWLQENSEERQVPTWEEFSDLQSALNDAKKDIGLVIKNVTDNYTDGGYITKQGNIASASGYRYTAPFAVQNKMLYLNGYSSVMGGAYQISYYNSKNIDAQHFIGGAYFSSSDKYLDKYTLFEDIPVDAIYAVITMPAARMITALTVDSVGYVVSADTNQSSIFTDGNKRQARINIGVNTAKEVIDSLYKHLEFDKITGKYIDKYSGSVQTCSPSDFSISTPISVVGKIIFYIGSYSKMSGAYVLNFFSDIEIGSDTFISGYDIQQHDVPINTPTQILVPQNAKYLVLTYKTNISSAINLFYIESPNVNMSNYFYNSIYKRRLLMVGDSITAGQGSIGYYEWTYSEDGTSYKVRGNGPSNPYAGDDYHVGQKIYNEGTWSWYESLDSNGYANLFKKYLSKKSIADVQNFGCAGIDSQTVLQKIEEWVDLSSCNMVCVMIGTNDRSLRSLKDFQNNLSGIVDKLVERNIEVVLVSPPPVSASNEVGKNFRLEDIDMIMQKVAMAKAVRYISIYQLMCDYCLYSGTAIDDLLADGIHPNDNGYEIVFKMLCKSLSIATAL